MKWIAGAFALLSAAFAALALAQTSSPLTVTETKRAVATGSGFVVSTAGHIVTAAHVVNGCSGLHVKIGGTAESAKIIVQDDKNDVALIGLEKAHGTPLKFRQDSRIRLGEQVTALGYPLQGVLASGMNVTTGTLSGLAGPGDDIRLFQFTAPIQAGNSGGPLLDRSGHVIGLVTSKLSPAWSAKNLGVLPENINFAVKQSVVRDLLDSRAVEYVTDNSSEAAETTDVVEKASNSVAFIECLATPGSSTQTTVGQPLSTSEMRWKSLNSGNIYVIRMDGDRLYAERVLPDQMRRAGAFIAADLQKQGETYVGHEQVCWPCQFNSFVRGFITKQCRDSLDLELRFVSPTRVEGRIMSPPADARFDCNKCSYSKPSVWQEFTFVPE
jgi:hypothetical protein